MPQKHQYRWPTKLKKFGIEAPFLKILATKYENEIPWQIKVRDTASLKHHVENVMLPKFMERVAFPHDEASKNHFYIASNDVSLDAALAAEANRNDLEIETIEIIQMVYDDLTATTALVKLINERKYSAFKAWIDLLEKEYPNEPGFRLLLLRPLFELSGRGIRRTVIEPSLDVIEWLHRRIKHERLLPDENIANQYCLKLGMGSQKTPSYGWQFIPAGIQNAAQLSAASRGSGWCIAERSFATFYLEDCEFYILHSDNKPVVALRVSADDQIIQECRGRFNETPDEWFEDIDVFVKTQGRSLFGHEITPTAQDDFDSKSEAWWKECIKLWPFAVLLAPAAIKTELMTEVRVGAFQYANFKNFQDLAQRVGLNVDEDFWRMLVEVNPSRYVECPSDVQARPSIQEACITGWVSWVEDDQMTAEAIRNVPEFVRINPHFQEALGKNFLTSLRDTVRKFPNTLSERGNRFNMQDALPALPGEPAELALERMVNVLLTNEDGIFSDDKFADIVRQRDDFLIIREQAWLAAIQTQPPLWFALPVDLRSKPDFKPTDTVSGRVDLEKWRLKVLEKPWLLTQKNGVPKSIRQHRRILEAYRESWLPHLRKSPWRLWISINPRRVYMSSGLLADDRTLYALTDGWKLYKNKIVDAWFSWASERMRNLPMLQVSVLRAIGPPSHLEGPYPDVLIICHDIKDRLKQASYEKLPETPFDKKIRTLLAIRGIT